MIFGAMQNHFNIIYFVFFLLDDEFNLAISQILDLDLCFQYRVVVWCQCRELGLFARCIAQFIGIIYALIVLSLLIRNGPETVELSSFPSRESGDNDVEFAPIMTGPAVRIPDTTVKRAFDSTGGSDVKDSSLA